MRRIVKEANRKSPGSPFKSQRKNIQEPSISKGSIDEFEEEIIKRIIYSYAAIHKRIPAMKTLFKEVKNEVGINFTGKIDSFRK